MKFFLSVANSYSTRSQSDRNQKKIKAIRIPKLGNLTGNIALCIAQLAIDLAENKE